MIKLSNRVYKINDMFFDSDSLDRYYILGLYASDGSISKSTISISQSGLHGKELINYIKTKLEAENPIYVYKPSHGNLSYGLSFRSKKIMSVLNSNNIVSNKSLIYTIPKYILDDKDKLRYFLVGYIDGDGCVGIYDYKDRNPYLIIEFLCSIPMYEQLKDNALFSDCVAVSKNNMVEIRFNGLNAYKFGSWLYDNLDDTVYKSHKLNKYLMYTDRYLQDNQRFIQRKLREFVTEAILSGKLDNPKKFSEKHNIRLGYIYNLKWELKRDGKICTS